MPLCGAVKKRGHSVPECPRSEWWKSISPDVAVTPPQSAAGVVSVPFSAPLTEAVAPLGEAPASVTPSPQATSVTSPPATTAVKRVTTRRRWASAANAITGCRVYAHVR